MYSEKKFWRKKGEEVFARERKVPLIFVNKNSRVFHLSWKTWLKIVLVANLFYIINPASKFSITFLLYTTLKKRGRKQCFKEIPIQ